MPATKKRLMERFEIPACNLDFDYIKKCNNAREMEKIVRILQSGEEGFYEELTKCAENRLRQLLPNSKCFRSEAKILTKDGIDKAEWEKDGEPVVDWSDEVKVKDNFLSVIANEKSPAVSMPDIRGRNKKIGYTKEENRKLKDKSNAKDKGASGASNDGSTKRIKSTDYQAWDKYDADTECLKMEFDEERNKERNEINKLKQKEGVKIEKIEETNETKEIIDKLTNVEKEALSLKLKDRGNDYFRCKEYDNALVEYSKCIEIYPTAAAYNNRAITYMKLFNYTKAMEDLEKCLQIDSKNIKALLRKAQCFVGMEKRRDAYSVYTKILSLEPSNIMARNGLTDLQKQLPDLPPATATRISIKEDENTGEKTNDKSIQNESKLELEKTVETVDCKKQNDSQQNIQTFIDGIVSKDMSNDVRAKADEIKSIKESSKKGDEFEIVKNAKPSNKENIELATSKELKPAPAKRAVAQKKQKSRLEEDESYVQEDLAKLIKPKKIVRSKLAKTMDMFKNNKVPPPNTKKSQQIKNRNSVDNMNNTIKLLPDRTQQEVHIKELR